MPVYEYHCESCGPFTELRGLSESSGPANCPQCGSQSAKVFPIIHLRSMRPENRKAWERNERSAAQPHVCGAGCSHLKKTKKKESGRSAYQYSKKQNSRPWMLGH